MKAFVLLSIIAMATGCGNSNQPAKKIVRGPVSSKLNEQNTKNLTDVISGYYMLKNALVASDATRTAAAAKQLLASVTLFNSSIQTDTANYVLLKPFLDTITLQTQAIGGVEDPKCERQRIAFSPISNNMFSLLKATGIKNSGVYKEFCPMAFNDKGAFWLSDETEIKNPYFGKKMLECGEVQDSL